MKFDTLINTCMTENDVPAINFSPEGEMTYKLPNNPNRKTPLRLIAKKLGGEIETNLNWGKFDDSKTEIAQYTGYNPDSLIVDGKKLYLGMSLEGHTVYISGIVSEEKDSGLGTKFMNELKKYSDSTGHDIFIYKITNPKFFEKFDWLIVDRKVQEAKYNPKRFLKRGI